MAEKTAKQQNLSSEPVKKPGVEGRKAYDEIKSVIRTTAFWIILCFPIMSLSGNYYSQLRNRANYDSCLNNMKVLGTALEMYSMDNAGHYPLNWDRESKPMLYLVPDYLPEIPKCPSAGKDTYSNSYMWNLSPDAFTFHCTGKYHENAGIPENFPQFNSTQGLLRTN